MSDLVVGARFEDIVLQLPTGERVMDYARFQLTTPHGPEELAAVERALGELPSASPPSSPTPALLG